MSSAPSFSPRDFAHSDPVGSKPAFLGRIERCLKDAGYVLVDERDGTRWFRVASQLRPAEPSRPVLTVIEGGKDA